MKKSLKCGIIGFGYMGKIRYRVIRDHPKLVLSTVCDATPDKLLYQKEILVVSNPIDVINSDLDIIFVCTPNHLIPEITAQSLSRGKHVFCEKPPGKTLADIQLMQNAEKNNPGTKLMFGFNHRFHPGVIKAKAIADSGRMGKVRIAWTLR